ncbi:MULTISPECIES: LysR family transcriptional regulator [Serratia]|uniref:LysR family transcriptional regulator n=1 Tax=Serratia TaxID=613 RepID=UPI0004E67CDA|nr:MULTISPECIES: LysR family transcriptional regulator [Serratia]KFF78433.1 LysR family transcriptional regulator [Serratia marcescens]MBH2851479.1 LysR family transcriptional regulator [Serratia marcescens]MBK5607280.1 LysR family transcriptional regulator [Serratia marcescens]CAI1982755.1 D-malate degradation protein R [Serratia marcescens]BEN07552.1 LysR family transcriptional regulator [Serratia marcescens]
MNDARYVEHLPIFLDVAHLGSFSAAARQLGMVPSSLVRHIDALESALGATLFVRSTRGLLLTDAGELLLTRAAALMTDITGLRAELNALNETPQGTLRISCLPTFGKTYVLPLLPTLAERYPQLWVDLDLTERQTDPTQERLDAAIRIGEQKDSALYASRIATQRWVMCASPAYVARYGLPSDLEALPQHRLIARYHKQQPACWAQILDAALMSRCTMALRCDDFTAQRQAALLGLGIAFLPNWVVGPDVQHGQLVQMLEDPRHEQQGIYLLRPMAKVSARLAAFTALLQQTIGQPPSWG